MEERSTQGGTPPLSPALAVVGRRLRAARKKLSRITELEALQAAGKELTAEQLPALQSKPALLAVIDELQKVEEGLRDAIREEQSAAFARGLAQAQAEANAEVQAQLQLHADQAAQELKRQEHELLSNHADVLAQRLSELRKQHEQELEEQRQQLLAAADEAQQAAVKAAAQQAIQNALSQQLDSKHPLKDLITEPVRKLMTLMYYCHLFDHVHNWQVAPGEIYALLQYDSQTALTEDSPPLTHQDVCELSFFGRTLVDRMDHLVSHQQAINTGVALALNWLLDPEATAINAPPAPAPVRVGLLKARLERIMNSQFSQVVPSEPSLMSPPIPPGGIPPAAHAMPPPPPPPPSMFAAAGKGPSAPGSKPDSPYPTTSPAPQAPTTLTMPPPPAPEAAVPSAPPAQPLLPGFLDDTLDNDGATVVTAAQQALAAAMAPPTTKAPSPQTTTVVPGTYVLSESGLPELRSHSGLGLAGMMQAPLGGQGLKPESDLLAEMLRNKANLGVNRAPAQPASGQFGVPTSGLAGGTVLFSSEVNSSNATPVTGYYNGSSQSRGAPPGVGGGRQGGRPWQARGGRGGRGGLE